MIRNICVYHEWVLTQVAVHNKNLHNSLHLHQRQRPRRRATIPPPACNIRLGSPHRARGNSRVRALRHQPRRQGDLAVRAARVIDDHRCAAETRCAAAGGEDVCRGVGESARRGGGGGGGG